MYRNRFAIFSCKYLRCKHNDLLADATPIRNPVISEVFGTIWDGEKKRGFS